MLSTSPSLKYMLRFMFWVYLKVSAIFQVLNILSDLRNTPGFLIYFRFLDTPSSLKYILCFIFWVYLKIFASFWVSSKFSDVKYTFKFQVYSAFCVLDIFKSNYNFLDFIYITGSFNNNKKLTAFAKKLQKSMVLKNFYFSFLVGKLSPKQFRSPRDY